ncbi:MAG: tRNA uridine-5-carboxymethylaminomethyl(34) synthesis GTPase MnmE [Alphaproteobacteria bacterium]|nr:tRNA uridine-5-carboxymethylaminomethyl(34) synthesis GTPase MnmE [Alphaproteobacteria bacterium]MDE2337470.1 tRNA uridine-5-carboxymethylaminomethyl(34) synthesis GTPase MnmE [Alphaproteobacteria bacterium]
METIYAVASGLAPAGVAIIRVSGAAALLTYKNLTHRPVPLPRKATFGSFRDPGTRALLDKGMALYFPAPASFTGEDVMEYHLHGGAATVKGFLDVLSRQPECRLAQPGEFTRRAFENGKMDLTAAEAVADLVAAETEAQRTQALEQLAGHLARLYEGWAERLQKILAHQEAEIEFPDEDMPAGVAAGLTPEIGKLLSEIRAHLDDGHRGERLRNGVLIAIVGAPNAGKSSLLNALARRDAAIVSEEAGTTRDIVEVHLDLGGYPVILADTAGLRDAAGKVEAEGIRRAKKIAGAADIKLVLFDGTGAPDAETRKLVDDGAIVVATKADLKNFAAPEKALPVSSVSGTGMDALLKALTEKVSGLFGKKAGPSLTRERHRAALQETAAALERSLAAGLPELAAEDLRLSLRALGQITGRVHVEALLDRIFKDFCIGK